MLYCSMHAIDVVHGLAQVCAVRHVFAAAAPARVCHHHRRRDACGFRAPCACWPLRVHDPWSACVGVCVRARAGWWWGVQERGFLRPVPGGDIILFCASLAVLLSVDRSDHKPTYRSMLGFIFGPSSVEGAPMLRLPAPRRGRESSDA